MNATDKLLNFSKTYNKNTFDWTNSILYDFLCDHYGLDDVLLKLSDGETVIIKKYNVCGSVNGESYMKIYESVGELDNPLRIIQLSDILSVTALL